MSKKCICLIRVSTQQQLLEGQREKVIENAIADGYLKEEIQVVEAKESAIKLKEEQRETLNEMKQLINDYPSIESVYVFAIDRLARKVSTILSVKDYLLEHKINLVFLNPHRLSTLRQNENKEFVEDELTSMMLLFLAYGAEMEMKLKQARMKVAKEILRNNNKLGFGRPLFGYVKTKDKSVVVDEVYGDVVRNIYYEYTINNKTMYDVYKELVVKGIFKEKKRNAAKNTIRRILENNAYYGDYSRDDKTNNIKYPPIIDKELWDKTQSLILSKVKKSKTHHKYIYYGKGLVRLMNSGKIMVSQITNSCYKTFDDVQASININAVDSIIWKTVGEIEIIIIGTQSNRQKINYTKQIKENKRKIENIDVLLEKIYTRRKKAFKLYMDNRVSDDIYNEEMALIMKDETAWEKEKALLQSEIQRYIMMGNEQVEKPIMTQKRLKNLNDEERKKLIDEIIKEVQVTKNVDNSFDIKVIPSDKYVEDTYNELYGNPKYHYYVRGGVMHIIEKSDIIEIEISDIINKRIKPIYK